MRLLRTDCPDLQLKTYLDDSPSGEQVEYAILSHTWLADTEEITFADLQLPLDQLQAKQGWRKLEFARAQAAGDGFKFIWVDTCCIDKSSSAELAEAINSMYRFYRNAKICYVYLQDLPDLKYVAGGPSEAATDNKTSPETAELTRQYSWVEEPPDTQETALARCRWFTRGWTLQEMIASPKVHFYNKSGLFIGSLKNLAGTVADITGVSSALLAGRRQARSFSIAQRMSWAATRTTTRVEDRAYSLLGLFGISMAIIYGEGDRAFQRLQEEILKVYSDHSLFAWTDQGKMDWTGILAQSPDDFRHSGNIVPIKRARPEREYEVTSREIKFDVPVFDLPPKIQTRDMYAAVLSCRVEGEPTQVILLELIRLPTGGFVRRTARQLVIGDIYDASLRTTTYPVNVLRYIDETHDTMAETKANLLMCRCKRENSLYPDFHINNANSLLITTVRDRNLGLNYSRKEAVGHWRADIGCFVLPENLQRPVHGSPPVQIPWESLFFTLECEILINSGKMPIAVAKLSISPNIKDWTWRVSNNSISFRPALQAERRSIVSSIISKMIPTPMASLGNGKYVVGRATRTKLLHESFWLCEIETQYRNQLVASLFMDAFWDVVAFLGIPIRHPIIIPFLLLLLVLPIIPAILYKVGMSGLAIGVSMILCLSAAALAFLAVTWNADPLYQEGWKGVANSQPRLRGDE